MNTLRSTVALALALLIVLGIAALLPTPTLAVEVGDHEVDFVAVRYGFPEPDRSTWYYAVSSGDDPAISHVTFALGSCLNLVDAGTWAGPDGFDTLNSGDGAPTFGLDPTTGLTGIKFDVGIPVGETRYYYITVDGNYAQAAIAVALKTEDGSEIGELTGPDPACGVELPGLEVSKDTHTSLARTYEWTLDKVAEPAQWALFQGDSGTTRYTVTVTRTAVADSNWAVSGTISIANPSAVTATVEAVSDTMDGVTATVDCGVTYPYELPAGETLICTYSGDLDSGATLTNTATVTTSGAVAGGSATAAVDFASAIVMEINGEIGVTDTNGPSWTFDASGSVTYEESFNCDEASFTDHQAQFTHTNTASIDGTDQSAQAEVLVHCYQLDVAKDATASSVEAWGWTIDKVADAAELSLSPGLTGTVNYSVTVDAALATRHTVTGTIWITNPHPSRDAVLVEVGDVLTPAGVTAEVDCPSLTVPAAGMLQCTYAAELDGAGTVTNTATAVLQNVVFDDEGGATDSAVSAFQAETAVAFPAVSDGVLDACVEVSDSQVGILGTVCAGTDELPHTFAYSLEIGPYTAPDQCGEQVVENVASFAAVDTGASGEAGWTVTVDVPCACTLTQGFWKTHPEDWPAQLSPETTFFLSEQTYLEVLWTPPAGGNAYYILAHQYIAAELNLLSAAAMPDEVMAAFQAAKALFDAHTPVKVAALKGEERHEFIELAELLDRYNNGLLGPGHCDGDPEGDEQDDGEPEEVAGFGCSPGFWKQSHHFRFWPVAYGPEIQVTAVFSAAAGLVAEEDTLLDALNYGGGPGREGGARILLRAAVAALLNEATFDDYAGGDIVAAVDAALAGERSQMLALAGELDSLNNAVCIVQEPDPTVDADNFILLRVGIQEPNSLYLPLMLAAGP